VVSEGKSQTRRCARDLSSARGAGGIFFFFAYTKGDIADLSPTQKARLRRAVDDIKAEFKA